MHMQAAAHTRLTLFVVLGFIGLLLGTTILLEVLVNPSAEPTVYITSNDPYYHTADCPKLAWGEKAYSKEKVIAKGYRACPRCQGGTPIQPQTGTSPADSPAEIIEWGPPVLGDQGTVLELEPEPYANDSADYEFSSLSMLYATDEGIGLLSVDTLRISTPTEDIVYGLTETQRRAVWRKAVLAQRRAAKKAREAHPPLVPDRRAGISSAQCFAESQRYKAMAAQLEYQYMEKVAHDAGLTLPELADISMEAFDNSWPLPSED